MSYHEFICTEVKTRKNHQCVWCGEEIVKGEKANYRKYVYDGVIRSDHMHLECFKAMGLSYSNDEIDSDEGFEECVADRGKTVNESKYYQWGREWGMLSKEEFEKIIRILNKNISYAGFNDWPCYKREDVKKVLLKYTENSDDKESWYKD